jgi:hypothetical protein
MAHDFVPGSGGVAPQLQAFVVPALRKKREGRGTHCVPDAGKGWATRPQYSKNDEARFDYHDYGRVRTW